MAVQSLHEIEAPHERIIAALDYDTWEEAEDNLAEYADMIGLAKVNSIADRMGMDAVVDRAGSLGVLVMADYKLNDIADTMRRRAYELAASGVGMITVHASAGIEGMRSAVAGVMQAEAEPYYRRPWVVGVSVLTSLSDEQSTRIFGDDRAHKVTDFAHMAAEAGMDGLVCSPQEAQSVKSNIYTEHLKLVIPAIRPSYAVNPDEQVTAATPRMAIQSGADMLVVGRPLTQAGTYGMTGRQAAEIIAQEIKEA